MVDFLAPYGTPPLLARAQGTLQEQKQHAEQWKRGDCNADFQT